MCCKNPLAFWPLGSGNGAGFPPVWAAADCTRQSVVTCTFSSPGRVPSLSTCRALRSIGRFSVFSQGDGTVGQFLRPGGRDTSHGHSALHTLQPQQLGIESTVPRGHWSHCGRPAALQALGRGHLTAAGANRTGRRLEPQGTC